MLRAAQRRLAPRRSAEPARTLREGFLDHVVPFESPAAAQAAIDVWVESYNCGWPHQSLDMATPASLFRPNGPTRLDTGKDPDPGVGGHQARWSSPRRSPRCWWT
jgi:integrase-like protein